MKEQKADPQVMLAGFLDRVEAANRRQPFSEDCLSSEQVLLLVRGDADTKTAEKMLEHLSVCQECQELVTFAKKQLTERSKQKEAFLEEVQKHKSDKSRSFFYAMQPFRFAFSGAHGGLLLAALVLVLFSASSSLMRQSRSRRAVAGVSTGVVSVNTDAGKLLTTLSNPDDAERESEGLKTAAVHGEVPDTGQLVALRTAVWDQMKSTKKYDEKQWKGIDENLAIAELLSRYEKICQNDRAHPLDCEVQSLHLSSAQFDEGTAQLATTKPVTDPRMLRALDRSTDETAGISILAISGPGSHREYHRSDLARTSAWDSDPKSKVKKLSSK